MPVELLDGDSFEWRADTGEGLRTIDQSVAVRAPDRVCVQVRMIRDSQASAWKESCVD